MGFASQNLLYFASLSSIPAVSSVTCGSLICDGLSAYCCGFLDHDCCYESVYQFWWFWFIWVIFFAIISSCVFFCYRRRRYRQYIMVRDGAAPGYGTVTTVTSPPAYPATQHQVPTAPPPYKPNEQKPPAYVP